MPDLNKLDDAAFDVWLLDQNTMPGASDDDQVVEVFSRALREESPRGVRRLSSM